MEGTLKSEHIKLPPYISYLTFSNALSTLAEHGIPSPIDRSVLKQFSGFNQGLLLQTFRFMGLTNEKDEPTEKLHDYEKADQEKRKTILGLLLKERYPEQVKILPNGTPQKLKDSFNNINVEASVKAKCISFFLQTAKATGFAISMHILKGSRTHGPRKDAGRKKIKSRYANEHSGSTKLDEGLEKGMVRVPISIGIGATWSVIVTEDYTKDDVERFTQIIKITLGDGKKK